MTNSDSKSLERIPVGHCAECGIVDGDHVEWNFPNPSKCNVCGSVLETAGTATREAVEKRKEATA